DAMANVIAGCLEKNPAARRQRVQNAVIELRFAANASPVLPAASLAPRPKPAVAFIGAPASAPLSSNGSKPRPAEPPRADQFFFKPGEPVLRVRNTPIGGGLLARFQGDGRLSLNGYRARMAILIGASLVILAGVAVGAVMYFRPQGVSPVFKFRVAPPE